jgi:ethanolamine ammonia-lyase small subunit
MSGNRTPPAAPDGWTPLRAFTPARIALGAAGGSTPTAAHLDFQEAHAAARDAVHEPVDWDALAADLEAAGFAASLRVRSRAGDRPTYLRRPDLGRRLDPDSEAVLSAAGGGCDIAFVVADGLSAKAVQRHAVPLLAAIRERLPPSWRTAPLVLAAQGRVALGDACGALLDARLVAVLIGERPGLSAADSLGVYLTWEPRPGRSDAERNCLSNIRPTGLTYARAAAKLVGLATEAARLQITGVGLKEPEEVLPPADSGG